MTNEALKILLESHKQWLHGGYKGRRATLKNTDLRGANLSGFDLTCIDFTGADLAGADLTDTDLTGANLKGVDLRNADLKNANLDFSCLPLWCGTLSVHIDDRQAIQLLYHTLQNTLFSKNTSERVKKEMSKLIDLANEFHKVYECGEISRNEE